MTTIVSRDQLGKLEQLGEGATALVHRCDFRLPNDNRQLVFKELRPDVKLQALGSDRDRLVADMQNAVRTRANLKAEDRQDLDETSAWPLGLVNHGNRTVGLVMPLIPSEYFIATNHNGQPGFMPRDLSVMIVADAWAQRMGVDRSGFADPLDRALILINLVYAVARLHKHRIVYGDLSLKNAVFSPTSHGVLLLDCDGTASLDDPHRRQLNSPNFFPPEITNRSARNQDTRSDVYKLALCVVRALRTPGRRTMAAMDPGILEPLLGANAVAELRRALDPDPAKRPTAKDLFLALKQYHDREIKPPAINEFRALSSTVHRGGEVVLLWDVDNPDSNEGHLRLPDGSRHRIDLKAGQTSIKAERSGTFRLEVKSLRGGEAINESELIQVFDLPQVLNVQDLTQAFGAATAASIPELPTPEIPDFTKTVKYRPVVEIDPDFLPQVPSPSVEALLDVLSAMGVGVSSVAVVNDAIAAVSGKANATASISTLDVAAKLALNSLAAVPEQLRSAAGPVEVAVRQAQDRLVTELDAAVQVSMARAADRVRRHLEAEAAKQTTAP
jgi:serine/threonine protein kinase